MKYRFNFFSQLVYRIQLIVFITSKLVSLLCNLSWSGILTHTNCTTHELFFKNFKKISGVWKFFLAKRGTFYHIMICDFATQEFFFAVEGLNSDFCYKKVCFNTYFLRFYQTLFMVLHKYITLYHTKIFINLWNLYRKNKKVLKYLYLFFNPRTTPNRWRSCQSISYVRQPPDMTWVVGLNFWFATPFFVICKLQYCNDLCRSHLLRGCPWSFKEKSVFFMVIAGKHTPFLILSRERKWKSRWNLGFGDAWKILPKYYQMNRNYVIFKVLWCFLIPVCSKKFNNNKNIKINLKTVKKISKSLN